MTIPATEKAAPIPALLPCPFCGVDGSIEEGLPGHFMAICLSCYCNVGENVETATGAAKHMFESADEAAEAWNRRADRASQEELIRELEAEIEEMTPKFVAYEYLVSPAGEEIALAENVRLLNRITALEAEASEGERLQALLADIHRTSPKPYRLDRPGLTHGQAAEIGYGALRDAIQARVAAALIPAQAREVWQPIETAPKDGTVVWVWCPAYEDLGSLTSLASWHEDAGWCVDELRAPTMWRPLQAPPPPSQDREG